MPPNRQCPFRSQADRAARRDKDLAAMYRAGYDRDTCLKVIDADPSDLGEADR